MIERLTLENLSDVEEIGHAFTAEAGHPGGFNMAAFRGQWGVVISAGLGEILAVRKGGRVAGLFGAAFLADGFSGWMTAVEQFWYVLPEYRGSSISMRLFREFEQEAARRSCKKILMVHLVGEQSEKLERFYQARGYRLIEKTYGKLI